jgi:hypothetical protein
MRKGTLIYSVILLGILISLVAFSPAGAETIIGTAKFDPNNIDLSLPDPRVVKGTIRFETESVADINASTVLLEGSLPPDTTYLISGGLTCEFDGTGVVNILWGKITHMGEIFHKKIWLTITGKLVDTAGGTPFSAEGYFKLEVPNSPPPP